MANGHAAAFAVTVEENDIGKLQLETFDALQNCLQDSHISMDTLASFIKDAMLDYPSTYVLEEQQEEEKENMLEHMSEAEADAYMTGVSVYNNFCRQFEETYGIKIWLDFHGDAQGDVYDEVEGAFWQLCFHDVYTVTQRAQEMAGDIPFDISRFVIYE